MSTYAPADDARPERDLPLAAAPDLADVDIYDEELDEDFIVQAPSVDLTKPDPVPVSATPVSTQSRALPPLTLDNLLPPPRRALEFEERQEWTRQPRRRSFSDRHPVLMLVPLALVTGSLGTWLGLVMLGFAHAYWYGKAGRPGADAIEVNQGLAIVALLAGLACYLMPAAIFDVAGRRRRAPKVLTAAMYLAVTVGASLLYLVLVAQMV